MLGKILHGLAVLGLRLKLKLLSPIKGRWEGVHHAHIVCHRLVKGYPGNSIPCYSFQWYNTCTTLPIWYKSVRRKHAQFFISLLVPNSICNCHCNQIYITYCTSNTFWSRPPRADIKVGVVSYTPSLHFVIPVCVMSHSPKSGISQIFRTFFWDTRNLEFPPYGNPQLDDKSCVTSIANRSLAILEV